MKKLLLFILIINAILFAGCTKPTITGKVFDIFGNPVKDATVKIEGTQFTCQSAEDGSYSVGYVPGDIMVKITKQGFTENSFPLKISTEATFPAENKTIYELPSAKGIWFLDLEKKQYVSVKPTSVQMNKWDSSRGFFYSETESYTVPSIDNNKTEIYLDKNKQLTFLDYDSRCQSLVKLSANKNGEWEILNRIKNNGDFGFMAGDFNDNINIQKVESNQLGNGLTLLNVSFEPNEVYVFSNYIKKNKNPIQDMAYLISTGKNATKILIVDPSEIDR